MNEEGSSETIPMKVSPPAKVDAGMANQNTVPLVSGLGTQTTNPGYKGPDAKVINPTKLATGGKPALSRALLGGAIGLAVIASAAAAYSFSTRYPIPAEGELASGTDPVSSLVRDKLNAQKAANAEEMSNLKKESQEKLQAMEKSAQSAQSAKDQQTADLEKLNVDLKLKDEEIKKIQDTLANRDADHSREIAANQLKIEEFARNAKNETDMLRDELAKRSAVPISKVKPDIAPPKQTQVKIENVDEHDPKPIARSRITDPAIQEFNRPSPLVNIVYGLDSRTAEQYWYFISPDGFTSKRYPSRELAISDAYARGSGSGTTSDR